MKIYWYRYLIHYQCVSPHGNGLSPDKHGSVHVSANNIDDAICKMHEFLSKKGRTDIVALFVYRERKSLKDLFAQLKEKGK